MLTAIALIVLVIRLIIKLIRGRPAMPSLKIILIVLLKKQSVKNHLKELQPELMAQQKP